jgi:hypothetical protein
MSTLALGGVPIIAAGVGTALLLVLVLFRAEDRFEAEDRAAERRAHAAAPHPAASAGGDGEPDGSAR